MWFDGLVNGNKVYGIDTKKLKISFGIPAIRLFQSPFGGACFVKALTQLIKGFNGCGISSKSSQEKKMFFPHLPRGQMAA